MKQPKTIIITGKQGAGKATQVKYLMENLKGEVFVFDTGASLRKFMRKNKGNFAGDKIRSILDAGGLVPYWFPLLLLDNALVKFKGSEHLILDGIARKPKQAELLDKILKWFDRKEIYLVDIQISDEEAIRRSLARAVCSKCGRDFVISDDIGDKKCDICKGKIIRRHDDDLETLKKRLTWSNNEVREVVEMYKNVWNYVPVDGEQSRKEVSGEIAEKVGV